jgi:hypothetical protein
VSTRLIASHAAGAAAAKVLSKLRNPIFGAKFLNLNTKIWWPIPDSNRGPADYDFFPRSAGTKLEFIKYLIYLHKFAFLRVRSRTEFRLPWTKLD